LEKTLEARQGEFDYERAELDRQVGELREQLEAEQVKNRILTLERDELLAVVARNRERVRAENEEAQPRHENGVVNRLPV
jgi:regulator of replication initiation timing